MRRGLAGTVGKAVLGAALAAVAIAGCSPATRPEQRTSSVRSLDPDKLATTVRDQNGSTIDRGASRMEDRDYVMGRNANPHLIIGHHAVTNKDAHVQQMESAAKSVPGVEGARVTLNGGNAYVTLDLAPNITAGQARAIEQQVIAALRLKAPRYDIRITSNDGYHR